MISDTENSSLKVLVVDDSVIYRKIISDVLTDIPGTEVVGTAANGRDAIVLARNRRPDMMTLDVEMPVMDGLQTLEEVKRSGLEINVVMVSGLTKNGARTTVEALQKGAYDFVTKPEGRDSLQNRALIEEQLRNIVLRLLKQSEHVGKEVAPPARVPVLKTPPGRPSVVVVGVSTGGPQALQVLLQGLNKSLPVPVVVVQHMPPMFTRALADSLARKTGHDVSEAADGIVPLPGRIYVAPGGMQMRFSGLENDPASVRLEIRDDPPENHCKPAVDYLFRSAARIYGGKAVGIIMTGMGSDGTLGLRLMKRKGAYVLAQDRASSVVYGMPGEAVNAGVVDEILPLNELSAAVNRLLR